VAAARGDRCPQRRDNKQPEEPRGKHGNRGKKGHGARGAGRVPRLIPRPWPLTPDSRGGDIRNGKMGKDRSGPVSRVLSRAVISLGRRLPAASSDLPGSSCEPDKLATVARSSPCVVLLQVGFAEQPVTRPAGALLPHRFTLTARLRPTNQPQSRGGLLSVALSLSLRTVGVTHHRVLWSPDFPLRNRRPRKIDGFAATAWPASASTCIVQNSNTPKFDAFGPFFVRSKKERQPVIPDCLKSPLSAF
jgi:hypothetical protein